MSGGMDRKSAFKPSVDGFFQQAESPKVIPIQSWVGMSIVTSAAGALVTAAVDSDPAGAFPLAVALDGAGTKLRTPQSAEMNKLYCCSHVKITWDTGTIRVFFKG